MRILLALGVLALMVACSRTGGPTDVPEKKGPVPTAVSDGLITQGEGAKALIVESMSWGEEYGRHPEVKLHYSGDREVANLYLYFEVYDAAGAKTDDLLAQTTSIRPGDHLTVRANLIETGREARCALVRILTIP